MMKKYLKLIRIKHWLKNILIFLPLFFSGNLLNIDKITYSILAFSSFSILASIVYIINDIADLEKDKKHPIKKYRPLASNQISLKTAYLIMIILTLILSVLLFYLYKNVDNLFIIIIPASYLIINILYSLILKKIPIVDVLIIVLGFVLRVLFGGIAIDIEVSKYLYLLIIFGGFYLALGKRKGEINKNNQETREVLSKYNKEFLDKNMYVSCTIALICYILWCVDKDVINNLGHDYMFWTIPFLMIIFEIYNLKIDDNSYADPVEVIFKSKTLIIVITIYVLTMGLLIYVI